MIHYINKQLQFMIIQDLHSLRNGSLDYSSLDDPTYRVCVEETKKQGTSKVHKMITLMIPIRSISYSID